MDPQHPSPGRDGRDGHKGHTSHTNHPLRVTRVDEDEWHAFEDGHAVGRGHATWRPDDRLFISVDAWHDAAFDRLAAAMLADLPRPLHVVADEDDQELTANWQRAGFTVQRREWDYSVPTDPQVTGLGAIRPPSGVTIIPAGGAAEAPLNALDRAIRAEASAGGHMLPTEILHRDDDGVLFPERHAVAVRDGRYVGLVRISPPARRARIGLVAVLADEQRRGIARALLAHALGALHAAGVEAAVTEVDEANAAATALVAGVGARRTGSIWELVLR